MRKKMSPSSSWTLFFSSKLEKKVEGRQSRAIVVFGALKKTESQTWGGNGVRKKHESKSDPRDYPKLRRMVSSVYDNDSADVDASAAAIIENSVKVLAAVEQTFAHF